MTLTMISCSRVPVHEASDHGVSRGVGEAQLAGVLVPVQGDGPRHTVSMEQWGTYGGRRNA